MLKPIELARACSTMGFLLRRRAWGVAGVVLRGRVHDGGDEMFGSEEREEKVSRF